ncbi:tumor necrosis factor receptor superfamily member 6 [Chaetodon trifascialis]|uniref:tumor necrosis factor receptor superfamily member 6 n=1 Tax=Chaetodon trifascialis TaxID=109706 RepID=UPI003993B9CE
MADGTNKSPVWFTIIVLFSHRVSVVVSSSQCVDGNYSHAGRDCCLCAAGQRLVEHCSTNLNYGKCDPCDPDKYSSHPTSEMSCEPCTSCAQIMNLEEDEPCTAAQDRKCRCKKDHFCGSTTEICRLCYPCKQCGAEGIKVPCAGHNDTVCNDKIEGMVSGGKIAGAVVGVIALIAVVGVAVFFWKKKKRQQTPDKLPNGNEADVEMQHLKVDLQPHLSDIARVIGWKDMKDVAVRSRMRNTDIEACKLDHPSDSQEQTFQLLREWTESQGMNAGITLIQSLRNGGKIRKAEEVEDILSRGS